MYFAQKTENIDYTEFIQHLISLYFDHKYDDISEVLKIENDDNNRNNIPSDRYYKKGMIFCEDENPLTIIRINVDEEIKYPLNTLLMISSNSIDEKEFISLIIDRWIESTKTYGLLDKNKIPKIVGKESYIQLKVGNITWNDFSKSCKNKGILIKNGFKMSLLKYLHEICSNNMNNTIK